ncbi:MAG: hypothetical protein NVS3B14_19160 [Ktedonobacteraceae bacterium]
MTFQTLGPMMTQIDVFVAYNPPAGALGDVGEKLGAGSRFENVLQHDLDNFAHMVDEAPTGALDPNSSNYLFHSGSSAARDTTTATQDRPILDRDIIAGNEYNRSPLGNPDQGVSPDATRPSANIPNQAGQGSLGRPDQGVSPDATRPSATTPNQYGQSPLGKPDQGVSPDATRPSERGLP